MNKKRKLTEEHKRKIAIAHTGKKRAPFSEIWRKRLGDKSRGRIPSEEARRKSSKSQSGNKNHNYGKHASTETRIKMSDSQKGRKHSEETRKKISIANKGKSISKETRKKISIANKGRSISEETREKLRVTSSRRQHSEETKRKISQKNKGKHLSEETKYKISLAHKGWASIKKHSQASRQKQSEWHIAHPNKKFKETGIELKIETELQKRQINYKKQVPLCNIAIVDFYLSDNNTIIQADGCYYHNCPIHNPNNHLDKKIRDLKQDVVLRSNGFKVYRFWEHEINKSVEECINRINLNQ